MNLVKEIKKKHDVLANAYKIETEEDSVVGDEHFFFDVTLQAATSATVTFKGNRSSVKATITLTDE